MADKKTRAALANAMALKEMAEAAAGGQTLAFAKQALAGLLAMGFDPAAALFSHYRGDNDQSLNYLQWLSANGEGHRRGPMLAAALKSGMSPEATGVQNGPTALWIAARGGGAGQRRSALVGQASASAGRGWRGGNPDGGRGVDALRPARGLRASEENRIV